MTDKKPHKVLNIKLETLTPVSVGNGEVLSPYTDFVFDDDRRKIHVLDKEKITDRIFDYDEANSDKGSSQMNEYMNGIYRSFNNNRSEFDLKGFLSNRNTLNIDFVENSERTVLAKGIKGNKKQEIKCAVKDNNQGYIPGSTLKGAIKAALLYNWFSNEGAADFNEMMRRVLLVFNDNIRNFEDLDHIASKRNISYHDKQRIKEIKRNISRNGGRELSKSLQKKIDEVLTKEDKYFPREFGNLKVKDSEVFGDDALVFQQTKRLHYSKGTVDIPANLEAVKSGLAVNFSMLLNPNFRRRELKFLNSDNPAEILFSHINHFHLENLKLENELLEWGRWDENAQDRELAIFETYQQFLDDMKAQIENAAQNEAFLCIGFGKSVYYNSILLLVDYWDENLEPDLKDEDKRLFKKYCNLFFLGKDGQKNFPLTRVVTNNGEPMGWVKLSV